MSTAKYLTGDSTAINEFLDKFDVFLFDCDGVLWSGDTVFEGVPETLNLLRTKGKKVVFVTNNSTKSRQDYVKKLAGLGISADTDDVFGSAYSSAIYISRILELPPNKRKVFVLGEAGIETELRSENVPFIGGTDPSLRRDMTPEDYQALADGSALDPEVGVVLVGLDFHINYLKLATAFQYIRRGAIFYATNIDSTLPNARSFFPGAGSIVAPLALMTGQQPTSFGKPSSAMMAAIKGKFELDRARTCMVGDRLNTDIQFGIDGGLGGTLAVLTGVNKKEDWEVEGAKVVPGYYVDRLSDLRSAT
ncbi:probable 4-nitrophenylphosphatase [Cephalotrichum gorgonifer]|uniref:4-nitrophenylphosphatase n=1 Tax=Cephalotrichum gorgonifer TaxID=2041049 RepID=A0AAE8MUY3_9PEZI|nr:probable 4-nitrophenylphosphatase [Cephalotrichum gorgonifer]